MSNLFDLIGNYVVGIEYEVDVVNRDGLEFHNSGVTVAPVRRGKAVFSRDYFSDTGENLRAVWVK